MAIVHINKDNFEQEVTNSASTVLLDFWATWCGPCQMLAPVLEQVAAERPDITIGKIDVDESSELAMQFNVRNIPKLVVVKNGKAVAEQVGYCPKDKVLSLLS
ncbi:MAG: thioredoxin [bacterium]|nr:thioredoxin [bacterium]